MELPKETGFYLWYILDFGYFNVGVVQIMQDSEKHIKHLRETLWEKRKGFYLYQTGFEDSITLTMYHQAYDHLPPSDETGKPLVDGWIPFDFRTVDLIKKPPIKLEGKAIPDMLPEDVAKLKEKYIPSEDAKPKFNIGDKVRVKPELAEISAEGVITHIIWNDGFHYYYQKKWEKEINLEEVVGEK